MYIYIYTYPRNRGPKVPFHDINMVTVSSFGGHHRPPLTALRKQQLRNCRAGPVPGEMIFAD